MTVDLCPDIVVSKNARYGILLQKFVGAGVYVDKSRTSFSFEALLYPRSRVNRIKVEVRTNWWEVFAEQLQIDASVPPKRAPGASHLGAVVIGEHMDRHGTLEEQGGTIDLRNDPEHDYLNDVDDDGIVLYVGAKLYWAWKFAFEPVILNKADAFRLGVTLPDLHRIALLGDGEYWATGRRDDCNEIVYSFTSKLLRDFSGGRFPGQRTSAITEVQSKLLNPRFAAPRIHFTKALRFLSVDSSDPPNAVKESVAAVESMASIVLGRSGATLGQMIKDLRSHRRIPRPLDKIFEALWGFASDEAGARHGQSQPPSTSAGVATWVVNTAAAAILHLLSLDVRE